MVQVPPLPEPEFFKIADLACREDTWKKEKDYGPVSVWSAKIEGRKLIRLKLQVKFHGTPDDFPFPEDICTREHLDLSGAPFENRPELVKLLAPSNALIRVRNSLWMRTFQTLFSPAATPPAWELHYAHVVVKRRFPTLHDVVGVHRLVDSDMTPGSELPTWHFNFHDSTANLIASFPLLYAPLRLILLMLPSAALTASCNRLTEACFWLSNCAQEGNRLKFANSFFVVLTCKRWFGDKQLLPSTNVAGDVHIDRGADRFRDWKRLESPLRFGDYIRSLLRCLEFECDVFNSWDGKVLANHQAVMTASSWKACGESFMAALQAHNIAYRMLHGGQSSPKIEVHQPEDVKFKFESQQTVVTETVCIPAVEVKNTFISDWAKEQKPGSARRFHSSSPSRAG